MKVAIYFYNKHIKNVDFINVLEGNPGVGGTEYCILCLYELMKHYHPEVDVTMIVPCETQQMPTEMIEVVPELDMLPNKVKEMNADVLVISSLIDGKPLSDGFFYKADKEQIRVITWGHNYYLSDYCNILTKHNCVKANVFVGKQQYDRYIDHRVIKKSTVIYNMYPFDSKEIIKRRMEKKSVTYIGSLIESKGFHVLAQAWKNILKEVPDAQLYVVGSGNLYKRESELGKYAIADKEYEDLFIPYLLDDEGKMLESVHFLGILGKEKKEVIRNTCVGVVNPTGRTETFGLSALDFESMSVPVVTIGTGGFLDTVINNRTGLLYDKISELPSCVIELLNNTEQNIEFGKNAREFSKRFSAEKIVEEWLQLFELVINNRTLEVKIPNDFKNKQLKWLRILNRRFKNRIHAEWLPAVIDIETIVRKMYRKIYHK
jgi:glycosyltransferase involved in cell wall biosynthesis